MKNFYGKLAVTNLKNNRQFYLPYLLAGMVSGMMFYIMCAIRANDGIDAMRGSSALKMVLSMGIFIVGVCAGVFLFYTNGFVMKRRKKELGIYNILGMEKKHIAKVMAWEAFILYVLSVSGGIVLGWMFHKLTAMFLAKLTGMSESIPFYISGSGCLQTAELFGVIYLLMLLYNFLQVSLANPITLLHGNNVGEREPKVKWFAAMSGIVCILVGYYLAVSARGVLEAVNMFFVAVLLVIAGTYALFLSVSIAFLKMLKNNKKYYYQTAHFITVSGMLYRMKRNAVGLANICVLSTMVLVIISTTVCLYAGGEDSLKTNFPKELSTTLYLNDVPEQADREYLMGLIADTAQRHNLNMTNVLAYADIVKVIHMEGNVVEYYDNSNTSYNYTEMGMLYLMARADYEKFTGHTYEPIAPGSVKVITSSAFEEDVIQIFDTEYLVAEQTAFPEDFPKEGVQSFLGDTQLIYVIVEDVRALASFLSDEVQYHIELDTGGTPEEQTAFAAAVREALKSSGNQLEYTVYSREEQRDEYMKLNGGFLFLGLFLGVLFLMITMLIIYYKQISEGFEDRERFAIMTKVGMGRSVVKAAINTQVRTVFFMPIVVAVLHLSMAFPMLKTIMFVFGLMNTELFVGCLIVTAVLFAVIYFIVFKLTSRSYYKIVYQ